MLKKIRFLLSSLMLVLVTLLFLDFTGTIHLWFGTLAKIQFVPAILALNFGVILFVVLLTLLFGRLYCSVICPLGIYQDLIANLAKGKKRVYKYSKPKTVLRVVVFAIFFVSIAIGLNQVVAILDPYSIYGRFANNLLQPIWLAGNNLLASFAQSADSYAFYDVETLAKSLPVLIVAVVSIVVVSVMAFRGGRTYCNTICPVGTLLGYISKVSLFRIAIDTTKCNTCTMCSRKCKSSCIDLDTHTIDATRCVTCFNCLDKCKQGAISYKFAYGNKPQPAPVAPKSEDKPNSRRAFLATGAILATSAIKAQTADSILNSAKRDGGLAEILPRKVRENRTPITPAGSLSASNMKSHCTACQLCVSACPNQVLRPSTSLDNFMQPMMSYEFGYCRPECTECSSVCPTGAINPITTALKSSTQIGQAHYRRKYCVVITDKVECGNCARKCPVGAITMVAMNPDNPKSRKVPVVNIEKCIGCGACEYACPARPQSAIWVEGINMHKTV